MATSIEYAFGLGFVKEYYYAIIYTDPYTGTQLTVAVLIPADIRHDTVGSSWSSIFFNVHITCVILGRDIPPGFSHFWFLHFISCTCLIICMNGRSKISFRWCNAILFSECQARSLPTDKLRPAYFIINGIVYFLQVVQ